MGISAMKLLANAYIESITTGQMSTAANAAAPTKAIIELRSRLIAPAVLSVALARSDDGLDCEEVEPVWEIGSFDRLVEVAVADDPVGGATAAPTMGIWVYVISSAESVVVMSMG